jgi:hypothetical protein
MIPGVKDVVGAGCKAIVSGVLDGASKLISNFKADPTKVAEFNSEIEKLKLQSEERLSELNVQLEEVYAKQQESVNATMREEAKSEHWIVFSWRPTIGFTFCAVIINNYILLPYFKNKGMQVIEIPGELWSAMLVILGAASAGRSFEKTIRTKK